MNLVYICRTFRTLKTKFKKSIMKKIMLNKVLFLLFAVTVAISSCKKDDETPAPTIRISSTDPASVGGVVSTIAGEEVEITLVTAAEEKIKKINATQKIGAAETQITGYPVTTFTGDRKSDTRVVTYPVSATATGDIVLRFEVTDDKDKVAAVSVTIRVTGPVADINTFTTVLLNNQESTTASAFYNPIDNVVYNSIAAAKTNSDKVHIIHALRNAANGGRKLIAPNSADATDIYGADPANPNRIQTWSTRNAPKFKGLTLSATDFDALTTAASVGTAAGTNDTYTLDNIGNLDSGSAFGVYLPNGKFAIGRITAVSGPAVFTPGGGAANAGSITITFKVQK